MSSLPLILKDFLAQFLMSSGTFRSKLYKMDLPRPRMGNRQVNVFFGILLLLGGFLFLVQSSVFGSMTGLSVAERVSSTSDRSGATLQEIQAYRVGQFVYLDVLLLNHASDISTVHVSYLIDRAGAVVRSGEEDVILAPLQTQTTSYRFVIPEVYSEMGATVSVNDGAGVVYRRVVVASRPPLFTGAVVGTGVQILPIFGLVLVAVFVGGYLVWHAVHRRRVRNLSFIVGRHLTHSSGLR